MDKGHIDSRHCPIKKHNNRRDARIGGRWESQPYLHSRRDAYHRSVSRFYDHRVSTG